MDPCNVLPDPLRDRVVTEVPPPPHRPLTQAQIFPDGLGKPPNWRLLQPHLQHEGRVAKPEVLQIIRAASAHFRREPNMLELKDPVTVVGDIHGQYHDLLRLLELGGDIATGKYLFLGDYVDRGSFSIEVVLLLLSIKLNYPGTVFMLRGNHECRQMTSFFNFRDECLHKYDAEVYQAVMDCFDSLPLACLVNNKFLAVHGGISPELHTLADLNKVNRFVETPRSGLFCDLMWADPVDDDAGQCADQFKSNQVRGCSYYYGLSAVSAFLKRNRLISIVRAHEAQLDGFKMHRWAGDVEFPCVITIFSAPNYCDVYNNKGAILKFNANTLNIQQFNYTSHPYLLPNFMNLFTWSTPFVIEKVLEMLYCILKPTTEDNLASVRNSDEVRQRLQSEVKESKIEVLRNKVKAVSKMMRMFKTLREDKELIMQLKGLCPDNRVPRGLLQEGRRAILTAVDHFRRAKEWDQVNEMRPES